MSGLGRFLEVSVRTADVPESLNWYKMLGFKELATGDMWTHRYAVVSDGVLCIGLHDREFDSPAITFASRMWSSSEVFPWSTCPITVITGGLDVRSASLSSTSSGSLTTNASCLCAAYPNSSQIKLMVSNSRRRFTVTMSPRPMHVAMIWVPGTLIKSASSASDTGSGRPNPRVFHRISAARA